METIQEYNLGITTNVLFLIAFVLFVCVIMFAYSLGKCVKVFDDIMVEKKNNSEKKSEQPNAVVATK